MHAWLFSYIEKSWGSKRRVMVGLWLLPKSLYLPQQGSSSWILRLAPFTSFYHSAKWSLVRAIRLQLWKEEPKEGTMQGRYAVRWVGRTCRNGEGCSALAHQLIKNVTYEYRVRVRVETGHLPCIRSRWWRVPSTVLWFAAGLLFRLSLLVREEAHCAFTPVGQWTVVRLSAQIFLQCGISQRRASLWPTDL